MNLPVPIPVIDTAVALRNISSLKDERLAAASLFKSSIKPIKGNKETVINQVHDALYFSTIICYAQGLSMLHSASTILDMQIPLPEVVKIWRGGCIIRSVLLETFYKAFKKDKTLSNLLLDKSVVRLLKKKERNLRAIVKTAASNKIAASGLMSALGYFDAYTSAIMPVNLIQAQRDFFGAHTYQRTDREGIFHTDWKHS